MKLLQTVIDNLSNGINFYLFFLLLAVVVVCHHHRYIEKKSILQTSKKESAMKRVNLKLLLVCN